jgi:hypothetical protein
MFICGVFYVHHCESPSLSCGVLVDFALRIGIFRWVSSYSQKSVSLSRSPDSPLVEVKMSPRSRSRAYGEGVLSVVIHAGLC